MLACGWKRATRVQVGMGRVGESEGARGTAGRRGLWEQAGAWGWAGGKRGSAQGKEREAGRARAAGLDSWVLVLGFFSYFFSLF